MKVTDVNKIILRARAQISAKITTTAFAQCISCHMFAICSKLHNIFGSSVLLGLW